MSLTYGIPEYCKWHPGGEALPYRLEYLTAAKKAQISH